MKTKTVKMAMYRNISHGYTFVQDVKKHGHRGDQILISNIVDVEFEIVGDEGEKDALKALKVEAIQNRIQLAQAELDSLL